MALIHDHDEGLAHGLPKLLSRRQALGVPAGGVTTAALAACGGTSSPAKSADGIPEETAGPYPGDGSNGPNVLAESGVVPSDITSSFGGASGTGTGVPTTVELTLLDVATDGGAKLRTSQLAIPRDICDTVYATDGYEQSAANLAQTSLDTDMVFGDGYKSQLATASGTPDTGIALELNVGV